MGEESMHIKAVLQNSAKCPKRTNWIHHRLRPPAASILEQQRREFWPPVLIALRGLHPRAGRMHFCTTKAGTSFLIRKRTELFTRLWSRVIMRNGETLHYPQSKTPDSRKC